MNPINELPADTHRGKVRAFVRLPVLLAGAALLAAFASVAAARDSRPTAAEPPTPEVQRDHGALASSVVPRVITDPDGAVVFRNNCASCHGVTGRGNGLWAGTFASPVPDLTRLALKNGKFDRLHLAIEIENMGASSRLSMPCWGRILRTGTGRDGNRILVRNLVRHIEGMQTAVPEDLIRAAR